MIVLTGMHRSGTSAVAMTLQAFGVDFGPPHSFYGADRWNPRGYLERNDVIDLNSRILTGLPRTHGPLSALLSQVHYLTLPSQRAMERRTHRLSEDIANLGRHLNGLAVKDPRFCLTMPAWNDFITASIVCLRHPLAVSDSLKRRQRIPRPVALRFWNRHAEALLKTPQDTTLFVDFDAISGPAAENELARILTFLSLNVSLSQALSILSDQFSPGLRHFTANSSDDLPNKTRTLWAALQQRRRT